MAVVGEMVDVWSCDLRDHGLDFTAIPEDADTVLLRFDSDELELAGPAGDEDFLVRLDVAVGPEFSDFRLAGPAYRRHQFLLPLHHVRAARGIVGIAVTALRWRSVRPPAFAVRASAHAKSRLIDELERRMIWIFGSAGSGTTWLMHDILGAAPSTARPDDDTGVRPLDEPGIGILLGAIEVDAERFYQVDRAAEAAGPHAPVFERHIDRRSGSDEFVRNPRTAANFRKSIREIVFENVLVHWGVLDYDYVAVKMPNGSHAADLLMSALPQARMIVIMRDGRDVIRSRFSPFASRTLAETTDLALRRYAVAYYSEYWNFQREIVERAFAAHDPERRLLVSYEQLRRGETEAFASVYRFIGASVSDEWLRGLIERTRLENVAPDRRGPALPRQTGEIGGYRSAFLKTEVALMTSIMGPGLRRYGYDTSGGEGADMIGRLVVPGMLRDFGAFAERVPEGAVLRHASGVYDDLWTKPDAELELTLPGRAVAIRVDVIVPPDPSGQLAARAVQLAVGAQAQRVSVPPGGDATMLFPGDYAANVPIRLTVHADDAYTASVGDQRELGLYVVRIAAEPAP